MVLTRLYIIDLGVSLPYDDSQGSQSHPASMVGAGYTNHATAMEQTRAALRRMNGESEMTQGLAVGPSRFPLKVVDLWWEVGKTKDVGEYLGVAKNEPELFRDTNEST